MSRGVRGDRRAEVPEHEHGRDARQKRLVPDRLSSPAVGPACQFIPRSSCVSRHLPLSQVPARIPDETAHRLCYCPLAKRPFFMLTCYLLPFIQTKILQDPVLWSNQGLARALPIPLKTEACIAEDSSLTMFPDPPADSRSSSLSSLNSWSAIPTPRSFTSF